MNILIPFFDDSTLFVAYNFAKQLKGTEHFVFLARLKDTRDTKSELYLSERQLALVQDNNVMEVDFDTFYSGFFLINFDLVYMTRILRGNFNPIKIKNREVLSSKRPYFIAGWTGIDFTPEIGTRNREYVDGLIFTDGLIKEKMQDNLLPYQRAFKFFPNFFVHNHSKRKINEIKKIYFFAQAIIPNILEHRFEMIKLLIKIAEENPDKEIIIKLRHLPEENKTHKHVELFSYVDLMEKWNKKQNIPSNVMFSDKPMEEVLKNADYCITCSSTAGMETIVHGIPTAFYLDYNKTNHREHYSTENVRNYLEVLNVIYTEDEIRRLEQKPVNTEVLHKFYSTQEDLQSILLAAEEFKNSFDPSTDWLLQSIKQFNESQTIMKKFVLLLERGLFPLFLIGSSSKLTKYLNNRKQFFADSKYKLLTRYGKWRN